VPQQSFNLRGAGVVVSEHRVAVHHVQLPQVVIFYSLDLTRIRMMFNVAHKTQNNEQKN